MSCMTVTGRLLSTPLHVYLIQVDCSKIKTTKHIAILIDLANFSDSVISIIKKHTMACNIGLILVHIQASSSN